MGRDHTTHQENLPILSVIIPHYNDLEGLDQCLNLLGQQRLDILGQSLGTHPPKSSLAKEGSSGPPPWLSRSVSVGRRGVREGSPIDGIVLRGCDECPFVEIIVVDNNSAVGLAAVEAMVGKRATVITALEQGAAMARNAGVAVARGDILAFIDSDCRPAPDWIEKGWQRMMVPDAQIMGGCVRTQPEKPHKPNPVEAFELVFAFKNETYINQVGFSVTANLFVKRDIFEQVGGFRNGLAEDKDWGQRAIKMGYTITYQPDVIVDHPARSNWSALAKKWQRLTQEEYHLRQAKQLGTINWLTYIGLILISPLIHSLQVLKFKGLNPMVKLKAIIVLFRIRIYRCLEAWRLWSEHRLVPYSAMNVPK